MRHTAPIVPQFYVTTAQPCPYLPGRMERKLFTSLQGNSSQELSNVLSKQGFRRSQNIVYRPACASCTACFSARIKVSNFHLSKSQRRIFNKNNSLNRKVISPWATEEQFELFRKYLDNRHADGGMADMDIFEFAAMIEESSVRSRVLEYTNTKNELDAVCLTDFLDDGLSLVYSFFNTEKAQYSLGTYMILDHVNLAKEYNLPYVYLGYWVPGSDKMAYKAQFYGVEVFRDGIWEPVKSDDDYQSDVHPLAVVTIADQVAQINLPGATPIVK